MVMMYRQYLPRFSRQLSRRFLHQYSTINENELSNFRRLAENWWNEQGEMKPLHAMNGLRVRLIVGGLVNSGSISEKQSRTPKPLDSIKLLDVGCGGGILSEALSRLGANVTGLDASDAMISTAQFHASLDPSLRIEYVCNTIEGQVEKNIAEYDVVVASEVLEHISEKEIFIESCVRALKPTGSIFITTINKTNSSWLFGIIAAERVLKLLPSGTHDWEKFITPQHLEYLLDQYGCTTLLTSGLYYNILTNKWFWSKYSSINFAIHALKRKEV